MSAAAAGGGSKVDMRLGRVEHGAGHLPALVLPASLRRLTLAVVGSVAFVMAGALLIAIAGPERDTAVVGAVSILVFGLFAIFGLYGIGRDVGRVALTTAGVHGGGRSELFVPWTAITSIEPLTIHRASMIGMAIVDAPDVRIPRRLAVGRSLNRQMYGVDVAVGGPTDRERAELIAALLAYYAEDPARRHEIGRALSSIDALTRHAEAGARHC